MPASGVGPPPPPGNWAMIDSAPRAGFATGADPARGDVQDASSAWKHCKNVARDDSRSPDLYDLLSHSVRETQYSFQPQGWPSQIRMLTPVVNEMPGMVTDRYNACQTVAFCGVFPEIRRAWASVDNSLFLWRFDKWQDVPIEYNGEEQSIVAVGLATPRPGVFVEAIRHLLVVCTTTEIVLLGVCCSGEACEEVTLQPLPLYSVPSDNVAMVSVASTPSGRIFIGGADGNLYEIRYAAADSWRAKRCTKVCHTGGLRQLLPAFLPAFLFGAPQALVDISIDPHRHILYTRTQASAIQVYDMGADGTEGPHRVAETAEFLTEAARAIGGREVFGRGAGDKKGASVAFMAPVPPSESRRIQLMTVTADGRRVYWSTTSSRSSAGADGSGPRPDRLRAEIARQAMPSPSSMARAAGGGHHAPTRGLEVVAACYASGALLLAEATAGEASTRIFLLSRDLTIPPVGTATGAHVTMQGLRETIAELDVGVPGEACAIRPAPSAMTLALAAAAQGSIRDELTAQNAAPAPRYAVVTTAGVLQVEKLRPADVLAQLLQEPGGAKLEVFFKSYGAAEAAAMCIQLAAAGPPAAPATVVAHAKSALDDPRLCGEPELRETNGEGGGAEEPAAHMSGGFDMGAVVPVAEPDWSASHKGLCLYVARLLQPIWDEPIVASMRSSRHLLRCALSTDALQDLEDRLRALEAFLQDFIARRKSRRRSGVSKDLSGTPFGMPPSKRQRLEDAARLEAQRTEAVRALVARSADGCFLLRALVEHNVSRLSARMEESARSQLRSLRFRDWVAGEDGEVSAAQLVSVLVSEHLSAAGGLAEDLSTALQRGCPSYFREADRTYYNASGLLRKAEGAAAAADRAAFTRDAVFQLSRVPLAIDLGQIVPQLALLRSFDAVVDLAAKKAAALDPGNLAGGTGPASESAQTRREETCYAHVAAVLRVLAGAPTAPTSDALEPFQKSVSAAERDAYRGQLLRHVADSSDAALHESIYAALVDLGAVRDLLSMDTATLEPYLVKASGLGGAMTGAPVGPLSPSQVAHADVLARFYIRSKEYAAAAGVYELLASRAAAPSDPPEPSLDARISQLQAAVLQARSCGDTALVDRLEAKTRVADVQQRLGAALTELLTVSNAGDGAGSWAALGLELGADECAEAAAELQRSLLSLEELYNDVARPCHRWAECLELLDLSSFADPPYVRQLWDLYLKAEWQRGWDESSNQGGENEGRAVGALRRAADAAAALGERFYPNDNSFPVAAVLLRLEQAAGGTWPVHTHIELESGPAQRALLSACGGSFDALVRAYEALLGSRGNDPQGEELSSPALRLRLLRSLRDVVAAGRDKAADRGPSSGPAGVRAGRRELGVLAAACEAYAAEARRLPQGREAEVLGDDFDALGKSLQGLMGYATGSLYG